MATWREQYLAALQARDGTEKANLDLYDYCTKLADEKALLWKQVSTKSDAENEVEPVASPSPSYMGIGLRRVASPAARPDSPTIAQIRQDLSKAQQERSELQSQLDAATRELDALKKKTKADGKRIGQLNTTLSQLSIKLRDREEELKGKAKLIENVQDENVTLNLQLNVAEERSDQLRKDNKELVDRWMARMGKEADKMNQESRFD